MDPLSAGVSLVGTGMDALVGANNARAARKAFEHRYQNTVVDMKKAGLNPALAYGQGGGSPQTHDQPLPGEQLSNAVGKYASARQASANQQLTMAQTNLLKAQTKELSQAPGLANELTRGDIMLRGEQTTATGEQRRKTHAEADIAEIEHGLRVKTQVSDLAARLADNAAAMFGPATAKAGAKRAKYDAELSRLSVPELRAMANYWSGAGKYAPYADQLAKMIQGFMPRINVGGDKTFNTHNYIPKGSR
nr:MAG: DNA pilot protein [Microvirus sp.]